jgi:hypothetical protein
MNIARENRAKLLFASLWRAMELDETLKCTHVDYDQFSFHDAAIRTSQGDIRLYSGIFYASGARASTAPFSIGFFNGKREDTNLYQLAMPFHKPHLRASIFSYLSILDFLHATGEINRTVEEYITRLTDGGRHAPRKARTDEYAAFKASVLRELPYDLEQSFKAAA